MLMVRMLVGLMVMRSTSVLVGRAMRGWSRNGGWARWASSPHLKHHHHYHRHYHPHHLHHLITFINFIIVTSIINDT